MNSSCRPLLVGEDNPHSVDPEMALHPTFRGGAGSRLASILGMTGEVFVTTFDRENLCDGPWESVRAKTRAEAIFFRCAVMNRPMILLGSRVSRAFGIQFKPFNLFTMTLNVCLDDGLVESLRVRGVVLPHPSGRCRVWNDRENKKRAAEVTAALLDPDTCEFV